MDNAVYQHELTRELLNNLYTKVVFMAYDKDTSLEMARASSNTQRFARIRCSV